VNNSYLIKTDNETINQTKEGSSRGKTVFSASKADNLEALEMCISNMILYSI